MPDVRTRGRPTTVNEQLADAVILHMTQIERVKEGIARQLRVIYSRGLDKIEEKVRRDLERIANRGYGALTQQNLQDLLDQVSKISTKATQAMMAALVADLDELAVYERDWMLATMRRVVPGVGVTFTAPTAESLKSIRSKRPFNGAHLRDWFKTLDADTQRRVKGAIREGVSNGEPTRQIVRRLRGTKAANFTDGVLQVSKTHAETVVKTAVQHTVTQAREDTFKQNRDVIAQAQWIATLDLVTCPICASLDSRVYPVGQGERPPAHPRCRCTTIPILKPLGELGVSLADVSPGVRASMDGAVPGNISFGEWLKGRSVREQNVVLGKARAQMFREGKFEGKKGPLDPAKVLGANRRPISVKALKDAGS